MYGNAVVTAVTVAIGGNGSKIVYFSHSARTAPGAPPVAPFGPAQVLDGLLWNTTRRTAPHSTERPGPKSRAVCRHLPADVLPPQSPQKRVRARPPLMTLGTKRTRGRGLAPEKVKRPKRAEVCSAPRADRLQHVACDDKHFPEPNPKSSASNANSDQTQ